MWDSKQLKEMFHWTASSWKGLQTVALWVEFTTNMYLTADILFRWAVEQSSNPFNILTSRQQQRQTLVNQQTFHLCNKLIFKEAWKQQKQQSAFVKQKQKTLMELSYLLLSVAVTYKYSSIPSWVCLACSDSNSSCKSRVMWVTAAANTTNMTGYHGLEQRIQWFMHIWNKRLRKEVTYFCKWKDFHLSTVSKNVWVTAVYDCWL